MNTKWVVVGLALLLCVSGASAATNVVNSQNWEDVYSVLLYSGLQGDDSHFVTSNRQATLVPNDIGTAEPTKLFTSSDEPHIATYRSIFQNRGFQNVTEEKLPEMNLELASRTNVTNFIVMDPAYSYNAMSLPSYALLTRSFVLFANQDNVGDVADFLEEREEVNDVLIYGTVPRQVKTALEEYGPEVINSDGDKFLNNIEIAKRTLELTELRQAILTNGDFIEKELMTSKQPIVFIGRNNVPGIVADFIQNSTLEVGVLIGNELVRSAQTIRRQAGISTIVKFGRGARQATGTVGSVEALDMFYLPDLNLQIAIDEIRYNRATSSLEVELVNEGQVASYFSGSYTVNYGDGQVVVGDDDARFIEAGETKTLTYRVDGQVESEDITVDSFVLFGSSQSSLEFVLERNGQEAEVIDYGDDSEISIERAYYLEGQGFRIVVTNPGSGEVYAFGEVVDVTVNDQTTTMGGAETVEVTSEGKSELEVPAELTAEDINQTGDITVRVYHGEREDALIKIVEKEMDLVVEEGSTLATYWPYAVMVLLVIMLFLSAKKKKQND